MSEWERQKREIESYNTFYSGITGRKDEDSLLDRGFCPIGQFVRVEDTRNDVVADPDFVLYDGSTVLMVEVKSGTNVEERHINQLEEFNGVSIEAAEDFLKDAEAEEKGFSDINVDNIESCIVYSEECIEECRKSEECRDMLEELKSEGAILTQERDSKLEVYSGEFDDVGLQDCLQEGVKLPKNPKKEILLTENIEKECLAVSIVVDKVLPRLNNGEVEFTPNEVSNLYPSRAIPRKDIIATLEFLRDMDACVKKSGEYVFRKTRLNDIMEVVEVVKEEQVSEFDSEESESSQSGLERFDN